MRPLFLAAAAVLALAACHHDAPSAVSSASPMLIDDRGTTMPFEQAIHSVNFRPTLPHEQLLAVAAIPPLNVDKPGTNGIAFEYDADGDALLLSEWSMQNLQMTFGTTDISIEHCTPVKYSSDAFIWSTPHGIAMTLQPDGRVPATRVAAQVRALIAHACR